MYYMIQTYLIVLLEVMCCKIFFETFCKSSKKISTGKFTAMPVLLSIILFVPACFWESVFLLKQIFVILVISFAMKWYNMQMLKKNLILAIIYQSIILVVDYITVICCGYVISVEKQTLYSVQVLMTVMSKTILFLTVLMIKHNFDKKEMEHFSDSQWIKFLFFPIFTICIIVASMSNVSVGGEGKQENLLIFIAVGLVGMNIVVFYLLRDVALREMKIHENMIFEIQVRNQLELYKTVMMDAEQQRKISHEYRNQIECIQALCETKEYAQLKEYLQAITGEVLRDLDCIDTNNAIVNAVINAKYQEAVKKGIAVICKINDLSGIQMHSQDIVLVLSNLLNNAIEACEKQTGQKMIKLKIVYEEKKLIIAVNNSYDGKMIYENGVIQTSKEDSKHHGMGIQNVLRVVEKYNGYCVIKSTENEFKFSIIIPESGM